MCRVSIAAFLFVLAVSSTVADIQRAPDVFGIQIGMTPDEVAKILGDRAPEIGFVYSAREGKKYRVSHLANIPLRSKQKGDITADDRRIYGTPMNQNFLASAPGKSLSVVELRQCPEETFTKANTVSCVSAIRYFTKPRSDVGYLVSVSFVWNMTRNVDVVRSIDFVHSFPRGAFDAKAFVTKKYGDASEYGRLPGRNGNMGLHFKSGANGYSLGLQENAEHMESLRRAIFAWLKRRQAEEANPTDDPF